MKNEAEKQEIISELTRFYEDLRSYKNRQSRRHNFKFSQAQIRSLDALRLKLQRDHGRLLTIISEHAGSAYIRYLNRNYEVFGRSLDHLDMHPGGPEALDKAISVVNTAIGKLQSLTFLETSHIQVPEDSAKVASFLFDKMQIHPKIVGASQSLFETGHYAQAIFEAFKAINNFVKERTRLSLDGKDLMAQAFRRENPVIKLNELKTASDRDEQEGFKFLFMGAMVGIRNPKAHDNVVQTDLYRTLEYLAFASLLMRRAEEGKVKRPRKDVQNI